jgi:hypothetical protein
LLTLVGAFGAGAVMAYIAPKVADFVVKQKGAKEAFDEATEALDRKFGWDRLPLPSFCAGPDSTSHA